MKVPKLQRDPVKQKARQMLTAVLRHVREGHDLNPKSHRYHVQLARENPDLEEATELLTLLSDRRLKHQR